MKDQTTEIAFILDRSGSMKACEEATISGFNHFLRGQQQAPGLARMSLILFDDQYEVPIASVPVAEVLELTSRTFVPRGSTALLDAIGRTIDELDARLGALPEAEHPGVVIVAILTDGQENSSMRYSWNDVSERIARLRDTRDWQFLFLGADADAIATATALCIDRGHSASYVADSAGLGSGLKAISRKATSIRKAKACAPMTAQEQRDLASPMQNIVAEEDSKERRKGESA